MAEGQDRAQQFLDLKNKSDLSLLLGVSLRSISFLLFVLPKNKLYREFNIKKRSGQDRLIYAPHPALKAIQRNLANLLQDTFSPRKHVYGFVRDRNIIANASVHEGQRWILRLDLEDFFPTINFGRVRGIFLKQPYKFPSDIATLLAQICTYSNQLPQGAPTSPVISNIVCRQLDRKLLKLAAENHCFVSRYADDVVFSTNAKQFPKALASFGGPEGTEGKRAG
ncbi:MAG: reverse transcriptase domain-containing protein [Pyrinomonadaceae bacterium]